MESDFFFLSTLARAGQHPESQSRPHTGLIRIQPGNAPGGSSFLYALAIAARMSGIMTCG
jgi:hypothetical protein